MLVNDADWELMVSVQGLQYGMVVVVNFFEFLKLTFFFFDVP